MEEEEERDERRRRSRRENEEKEKVIFDSFGTCLAKALARSLVVSVFPVPAGPSGAPPRFNFKAPINVL